jgi:hypothetical protein
MAFKTIHDVLALDHDTIQLLGFPLMSKVSGKAVACAMRMAGKQMRAADTKHIDGFNDMMADLAQQEASADQFSDMGLETAPDDAALMAQWLGIRDALAGAGVTPTKFSETFQWMVENEVAKHTTKDNELAELEKHSGLTKAAINAAFQKTAQRNVARTMSTARVAMDLLMASPRNDHEAPDIFEEMVGDAFQSAKKAAISASNSVTESLANVLLLKATEESQAA